MLYNYTSVKKMETKLYNIGGYSIPGGISIQFMIIFVINEILFNVIGICISKAANIPYINISTGEYTFGMIFVIFPIFISLFESFYKIQQYSFFEYIANVIEVLISPKNVSLREKSNNTNYKEVFKIDDPLN